VTGCAGHLGEALVRVLRAAGKDAVGLHVLDSPHTTVVGSIVDRALVRATLAGVTGVIHTATLLEESVAAGVAGFVFTSTTSTFGRALSPAPSGDAVWITEDVVSAHLLALDRAPALGLARYIISGTTAFAPDDVARLAVDAPGVVRRLFPDQEAEYDRRGWATLPRIDRVYVNDRARTELGWTPHHFRSVLDRLKADEDPPSVLTRTVGAKGYHDASRG
jgi:nucleoside-diphosphate-sugar epimerase